MKAFLYAIKWCFSCLGIVRHDKHCSGPRALTEKVTHVHLPCRYQRLRCTSSGCLCCSPLYLHPGKR